MLPSRGNPASQAFVNAFTKVYPKLAERSPVYAQLRNCIDLAVAAAYIRDQDFYGLAKWQPSVFDDEQAYPVETLNPPKQVAYGGQRHVEGDDAGDADRRRRADAADRGDQLDESAR